MENERPDPDLLLKQVQSQEDPKKYGKLKVFFGACAGVGKTYSMLSAAHEKLKDEVDVVAGVIESHGRVETLKLLENIPALPLLDITYHGVTLKEFDLDAALLRKPTILLVDELAHTNAPGSRHPKRWQDVEELLAAGIDVYTTLNVQHIESLNDMVVSLTGVRVKETVPDAFFDDAEEILLVDVPSEVILERLDEGKVYLGDFAKRKAAQNFFKIQNLIALREIALRRTAERVDALRDIYKKYQSKENRQLISDKILVCIGEGELSGKLLRTAKQLSSKLKSPWAVLYIENERYYRLAKADQMLIEKTLRLAEEMGGKSYILQQTETAEAIVSFALENGFTKIIIGRSSKPKWKRRFFGSLTDKIIEKCETVDVYIINEGQAEQVPLEKKFPIPWLNYVYTILIVVLCTLIGLPLKGLFRHENVIMIYLVGIVIASVNWERSAAILAACLSVLSYSFFFTHSDFTFNISDFQDMVTFGVLLLTSLVISSQTSKLRLQNIYAQKREKFTADLYSLSRKLISIQGKPKMMRVIGEHMSENFESAATIWMPDESGNLTLVSHPDEKPELKEESVARWAFLHTQEAGIGTNTMPSARGFYIPLTDGKTNFGVLGLIPKDPDKVFNIEESMMLESITIQIVAALDRMKLGEKKAGEK